MIEINFPFQESKAERRRRRLKKAAIAAGAVAAGAVVAWRVFERYSDDEPEPERDVRTAPVRHEKQASSDGGTNPSKRPAASAETVSEA